MCGAEPTTTTRRVSFVPESSSQLATARLSCRRSGTDRREPGRAQRRGEPADRVPMAPARTRLRRSLLPAPQLPSTLGGCARGERAGHAGQRPHRPGQDRAAPWSACQHGASHPPPSSRQSAEPPLANSHPIQLGRPARPDRRSSPPSTVGRERCADTRPAGARTRPGRRPPSWSCSAVAATAADSLIVRNLRALGGRERYSSMRLALSPDRRTAHSPSCRRERLHREHGFGSRPWLVHGRGYEPERARPLRPTVNRSP